MLGTTEGRFAIDHPVVPEQLTEPGGEHLGLSELIQIAIEAELPFAAGALQGCHELTAKNPAQYLDGKKERVAGVDPSGVIQRESTGGDHAMDMGMMLELLIPGVQHAEETDLGAQVPGIARHFEQGCGAGAEQQVVDDLLVLQGEGCQFPRQSENDVHVGGGQQFALTCLQPAVAGISLTLWAMPVSARVVGDGGMSAVGALIAMSAEGGGAAAGDGQQHFLVLPGHPLATVLDKGWPRAANQVGHLQERATHLGLWRGLSFLLLRGQDKESNGLAVALRWRLDRCR